MAFFFFLFHHHSLAALLHDDDDDDDACVSNSMTAEEQRTAWRLVSKRNAQRRQVLEASLGLPTSSDTIAAANASTSSSATPNIDTPPTVSGGDLD